MKVVSDMFTSSHGLIAPYDVRNRLLNEFIIRFALWGHILFIPVFYFIGEEIPFYNNIICVIIDLFCLYMNYRWRLRTVYILMSAGIVFHTFFCNIILGWQTGFVFYYFTITIYIFLIRKYHRSRIVLLVFIMVLFVLQSLYLEANQPVYPASVVPLWLISWLNIITNFAAIILISAQFSIFVNHVENAIYRAKLSAEEGERAKSVFLANMSHEIRSPLNSITGMIDLAMLSGDNDERNEYLLTAKGSADHLLTVIGDILDYSKIENCRMSLRMITFNIRQLVRSTMRAMDSSIYSRNLEMRYEISDNVPMLVKGDPARIRQVLINLLSNAIKFTEEGRIILRCSEVPDNYPFIEFSVEDTGIGIPADKIDTVFDRFTQLEWKPGKCSHGTGLGLAISRELVELMGGRISVNSTPGAGSLFIVRIPLLKEEASGGDVLDQRAVKTTGTGRTLNVLIAEDIFTNWLLYESYMKILGHSFKIVENGCMVLDELEQNSYDIVLMDLDMPDMRGEEALRIIRSGSRSIDRNIPVIALTGYSEDEMNRDENSFNGVVTKPIDLGDLERSICEILRMNPGEALQ